MTEFHIDSTLNLAFNGVLGRGGQSDHRSFIGCLVRGSNRCFRVSHRTCGGAYEKLVQEVLKRLVWGSVAVENG